MKISTKEFIERVNIIHNNKYDYSLVEYIGTYNKVRIICPIHGEFNQTPKAHLSGQGCRKCSTDKLRYKNINIQYQQQFINDCNIIHNNKYDYSLVDYKNTKTKIIIICPIHGEFEQTPNNHKHFGQGCPKCGYEIKRIYTNNTTYGVDHVQLNQIIRQKSINTMIIKYGTPHAQLNSKIKEQTKQTLITKFGRHNKQSHMFDILPLLQDYDWLFDQYIIQGKSAIQISDELGIDGTTICNYLRKSEIDIKNQTSYSYKCIVWLESIMEQENIYIQHAGNIGEYKIPGTRYRADGYCQDTNTIYEFHGDYWHGNPLVYESDIINESTNCTMGELYQKTVIKEQKIKDLGYNLVILWETIK